jgi:tetraacyldisaccharide 4'-kinase
LSLLYAHLTRARRRFYAARPERRRRLARPVISVGNLSVGGSGKTPIVELLARMLHAAGRRPAVLTRGYGREDVTDGALVVSDGRRVCAELATAGDEPLMLARNLPGVVVIVSPDRYLGGRLAERRFGCDVHVLDDGFQHLQLARDIDLLLAGDEEIDRPSVLPRGRLREPLDAARYADALLWTGPARRARTGAERLGLGVAFDVRRAPGSLHGAPFGDVRPSAGARIIAVAAIARPRPFIDGLRAAAFDVAAEMTWPDHHRFTRGDLERVRTAVVHHGASGVVTTEKDMVRLLPYRPLPFPAAWQRLDVTIDPAGDFDAWLTARLRDADARAAARLTEPAA